MCTEKCFELTQRPSSNVSRRVALVGGAAMAASAALGGVAEAGSGGMASRGGGGGMGWLTSPTR
jgi:hypothetical protein